MTDNDSLVEQFARLFFRIQRLMDRRMTEQGTSLARTKLLIYLERQANARACDVATFFSLAPRTITEAIDGLERGGLVERHPDPTDRRAKRIVVTGAGRRAIAASAPLRDQLIGQIFGALDDDERARFNQLLDKIETALQAEEGHAEKP